MEDSSQVELAPQVNEQPNLIDKLKTSAQLLVVGAEVSPLNEMARIGLFGVSLAAGAGPIEAAAVYGASTAVIEGAAAAASAPLLASDRANKAVDAINKKLDDHNIDASKENKVADAGIALVGGSAVSMGIKKVQRPNATKEELRSYGMKISAGLGVAMSAQGGLVAEGITNFNARTGGGALLGVVGALAIGKWAKDKLKKDPNSPEFYLNSMCEQSKGPQKEGIQDFDIEKVYSDERTDFIGVEGDKSWPVLTPIENNSEYREDFFKNYRHAGQPVFLALPPAELLDRDKQAREQTKKYIELALKDNKQLIYEQPSSEQATVEARVAELIGNPNISSEPFIDPKNNSPAAVVHFEGKTNIKMSNPDGQTGSLREAYAQIGELKDEHNENSQTVLLSVDEITSFEVQERLWEIYDGQFKNLVENHPSRQSQTKDELISMISDPETITTAHKVDGEIVSFGMFVGNIEACDWLNVDFYKDRYADEDEHLLYFPGIATDLEKQGNRYAQNIIDLLAHLISRSGKNARVVFQCTNISADYIPDIVEQATAQTGLGSISMSEMYDYQYKTIRNTV